MPAVGSAYSSLYTIPGTGGTITFTEFGSAGEKVKGTFDVISANGSALTQTAHRNRRFSVIRYYTIANEVNMVTLSLRATEGGAVISL